MSDLDKKLAAIDLPPEIKAFILAVLGTCEVAIRCARCDQTFWAKPIVELIDMAREDVEAAVSVFGPKASMHVCKGTRAS